MPHTGQPWRRRCVGWAVVIACSTPTLLSAQPLTNEAVDYRVKGYEQQRQGDLSGAMASFQKAMAIDPGYAAPHNDLGIVFEGQGQFDRAEAEYQAAIKADPDYLEAYTNLALLYEHQGQREKAIYYWLKRATLGHPLDAWTIKAKERLVSLGVFEKTQDLDWSIQEAQQEAVLMIAQEYHRAKELFASARYFEAMVAFEKVMHLEQGYRPIYTPYALEYVQRAQAALAEAETSSLRGPPPPPAAPLMAMPAPSVSGPTVRRPTVSHPRSVAPRAGDDEVRHQLNEMEQSLDTYELSTDPQGEWSKRPFP